MYFSTAILSLLASGAIVTAQESASYPGYIPVMPTASSLAPSPAWGVWASASSSFAVVTTSGTATTEASTSETSTSTSSSDDDGDSDSDSDSDSSVGTVTSSGLGPVQTAAMGLGAVVGGAVVVWANVF